MWGWRWEATKIYKLWIMKKYTQKYPKIHNFLWNSDYLGYRYWLITLIALSILAPLIFYFENKEEEAYKNSKITWGIVDEINFGAGKAPTPHIDFHYYNEKEELIKINPIVIKSFEFSHKCLQDRKIGDTVIIKYSTTNNSYAKIIECYWNDNLKRKYGFYKN